ncbi:MULTISPECIES: hypothetical protein [unclassified Leisingera]|uniref:hypothetical protein n=1 Tax=unclassified Leisingera TaxID=2614906 RepID=UPI001012A3D8|nr:MULTISPECIES: hypothetical protein [unclassified Leisingera]MBQ4824588.1 hypothetical protein [Leisingera sp. HS039]MCF6431278.1 hypothetical protein [Leisingera sp. MMG026]QAX29853.1 hypothetical protein ETW24_10975 [Leisingera sp. NJS204]QBR36575.1 hypothetical protein ETW23_10850 [Leisingera sp. NJS201]
MEKYLLAIVCAAISSVASASEYECQQAAELMYKFGPLLERGEVSLEQIEELTKTRISTDVELVVEASLLRYHELQLGVSDLERRVKAYDLCAEFLELK